MSIKELIKISRFYGKDPSFLLAGGGNTPKIPLFL